MESINMINGNGNATRKKLEVLLPSAIKFYGPKYENIIIDVVKNALFYEYDGKQSIKEIVKDITKEDIPSTDIKKQFKAFYFLNKTKKGSDQIIVTRPETNDLDYHILAHELFGHAVCGKIKPIVRKAKIYQRNGISLSNRFSTENDVINEGFMETIATSIVGLNKKEIVDIPSINYSLAKKSSDIIIEKLGKDVVLESLVLGKGGIARKYNFGSIHNEWKKLNKNLDLEMMLRNNYSIKLQLIDNEIDKNLERFEKRMVKVR